ncbi:uncharacterized protein KLLA0_A11979g [Kluyveromyces lactis]|uniref:KLLA0A11979p n=1 Tax=Kluyveromyces lactis (strain ATCC 8585 / CBS 2359 / DSM 70799 / NBRC 1267 / NRRL Y-1140 / WM37) TaxID=284590 RepID=Q6CX17_KLULA|nr:uncharacterized protein KLLA0_A11979g [Kluyveromyces lactis]CAH03110.1 KLLA0A11979p [Kluyveromyces lactis]|eukprot:XP_451522.1 uncharacterized protein KLLA0_A11979g [Kluyveromyces lactis]
MLVSDSSVDGGERRSSFNDVDLENLKETLDGRHFCLFPQPWKTGKQLAFLVSCFLCLAFVYFRFSNEQDLPNANMPFGKSPLEKKSVGTFFAAAGTVFFGVIAKGAFVVAKAACNPAALAAIAAFNVAGASGCIGAYAVGALCAAISAGLAVESGSQGWQWYKGSGVAKREIECEVYHYIPLINNTIFGGSLHTSDIFQSINSTDPLVVDSLQHIGVIYDNSSNNIDLGADFLNKRSQLTPLMYTWTANYTGFMTTTYVQPEHLTLSVREYANTSSHNFTWIKLAEVEWLSFNTYGINVDTAHIVTDHMQTDADDVMYGLGDLVTVQVQPCTQQDECYGYHNKFCLAAGQSSTMGASSDIVGKVYFQQSSKRVYACNIIAKFKGTFIYLNIG